mgnify:CR=1 FL=1
MPGVRTVALPICVGAHPFCGGASVVLRDVLPFVMVQGNPAESRAINSEGLKRRGFSAEDIGAIKDAYKLVFMSGKPMAEIKAGLAGRGAGSGPRRGRAAGAHSEGGGGGGGGRRGGGGGGRGGQGGARSGMDGGEETSGKGGGVVSAGRGGDRERAAELGNVRC